MLDWRTSVRARLAIALGLICLLVASVIGLALWSVRTVNASTTAIYNTNLVGMTAIAQTREQLSGLRSEIKVALNSPAQAANMRDLPATVEAARKQIVTDWQRYYPALIVSTEERQAANKTQAGIQAIDKALKNFADTISDQGVLGAATVYGMSLRQPLADLSQQLDELSGFQNASATLAFESEQHAAILSQRLMIAAGIAVLALTLLLMFWLIQMIMRPLDLARGYVESIAGGDLGTHVSNPYRDEFGRMIAAIEAMRTRLAQVVAGVRAQALSVSLGVGDIANGNQELSRRTLQQAESLEETAASMEQMTSTVRQNADHAARADHLADDVRVQAGEGHEVVIRAVESMRLIDEASGKIASIVGLIDDIAFQTNLLALNASIEAARAGEQGRGFAVVASEVRNLASRSAAAAKDIKTLVADSTTKVAEGSRQVSLSGETLAQITVRIGEVGELVTGIATASMEQSQGIEEVNAAVSQMDDMTQQNAALVEQAAAASRSLEARADELRAEVAFFRTGIDDEHGLADQDRGLQGASDQTTAEESIQSLHIAVPAGPAKTPPASPRPVPASERLIETEEDDQAHWATF